MAPSFTSSLLVLWLLTLFPLFPPVRPSSTETTHANLSPVLAGPISKCCTEGAKHSGTAVGKNITIAGVPTYLSEPPPLQLGPKKVILFFPDIYGPFYVNNELLQDYFASRDYYVLGIDYFFGDPFYTHTEPDFDLAAWVAKSRKQAEEAVPKWIQAVREKYGLGAKYNAVGYCFGAPYVLEISATDNVVAGAFAHPSGLTEDHFKNLTQPLLLSCAEADSAFPGPARNRAVDILIEKKAKFHLQLFSGVSHGFATRADTTDENALWAKEESARGVIGWFNRFSDG